MQLHIKKFVFQEKNLPGSMMDGVPDILTRDKFLSMNREYDVETEKQKISHIINTLSQQRKLIDSQHLFNFIRVRNIRMICHLSTFEIVHPMHVIR